MRRLCATAALLGAALAAAGCGTSAQTKANVADAKRVVTDFALARDARACDLLSDDAVQNVYGGYTDPVPRARANCRARSKAFKAEPVKLTQVNVVNSTTIKVGATDPAGKIGYTVVVRKIGQRWKIDQITQAKIRKF